MTISQYLVTLQHDKGKVTIQTAAVSPAQAARIVTDSEGAPLSAVIKVEQYKPPVMGDFNRRGNLAYSKPRRIAPDNAKGGIILRK